MPRASSDAAIMNCMRVLAGVLFIVLLASRPAFGESVRGPSAAAKRADFAQFVHDFANNYAYLQQPARPWLSWPTRYAAAVDAARSSEAFAEVLAAALDELHDFHAEVRVRNPQRWLAVPTFADIWSEPAAGATGDSAYGTSALVRAVRAGSDAQRAGIVVGDRVLRVDGVPLQAAVSARLNSSLAAAPATASADEAAVAWAVHSLLAGRADAARQFTLVDPQGRLREVSLPVQRRFDRAPGALTVRHLRWQSPQQPSGQIGVIRFNNSLGEQSTVAAFDAALNGLISARGLVLDLRDVPSGGNSSVALGIMGRFVHRPLVYQQHRVANYGQADVQRSWLELVSPRGAFTYDGPVVLLVNHWTGSMGEGMAVGFDAMQRATVVGTPMARLAGAVEEFELQHTGLRVAFATEQLLHPNGTPRERWLPPVLVAESPNDVGDPLLERAVQELERLSALLHLPEGQPQRTPAASAD